MQEPTQEIVAVQAAVYRKWRRELGLDVVRWTALIREAGGLKDSLTQCAVATGSPAIVDQVVSRETFRWLPMYGEAQSFPWDDENAFVTLGSDKLGRDAREVIARVERFTGIPAV